MARYQIEAKQAMHDNYWLPVGHPYIRERDALRAIRRRSLKHKMPTDWWRIVPVEQETKMVKYDVEVTDTFGGEANYCWVKRFTLEVPQDITKLAFSRRVKALIGWTGLRCRVSDFGNGSLDIRPVNMCQVCFTVFRETEVADNAQADA